MNTIVDALHEATHRVPGVPEHSESNNTHTAKPATHRHGHRAHTQRTHQPVRHHENAPRALVAWQNRIARLVKRMSRAAR